MKDHEKMQADLNKILGLSPNPMEAWDTHLPHGAAWPWGPIAGFGVALRSHLNVTRDWCRTLDRRRDYFMPPICTLWKNHDGQHVAHQPIEGVSPFLPDSRGYALEEAERW